MIKKNDTIGIIALSGECNKEKIEQAKFNLESCGYNVKLSANIFDTNRYLAGSDDVKAAELHKFFEDDSVNLILCARGGYGALRLINKLDYGIIKSNPKPFCGFSDVTALLLMIYKKTGIITYHAPMAQSDFAESEPDLSVINNFFDTINNTSKKEYKSTRIYKSGNTGGILWGGNLSTVVSLCGQDFLPDKEFIFFAEDINEPVYKIDKMFQQLINIESFVKNCKGLVFGEFLGCDNELWLEEYLTEISEKLKIPAIKTEGITHGKDKITVPVGVKAEIKRDLLFF